MKKLLVLLLALMLVVSMAACGQQEEAPPEQPADTPADDTPAEEPPADEGPEYSFTIGTSATSASIIGQTEQYLADLIMERTEGKIAVDCYPDSQLGSDSELIEGVQLGTLTMVIGSTAPQVSFVPGLAIFDLPNVYDDIATAQTVLAEFSPKMGASFEGTDLHLCTIFPTVFRYMSCSKEITGVDDFQNVKIRTMENPYHMAYWNGLGAVATPLAFTELYIGLQQGVVDAQENPLDIFMSSKFYEQQDYIIQTKHIAFVATILMNEATWNSMPAEYQEILNQCFIEAAQFGSENAQQVEAENMEKIRETGVTIIELDEATIDSMREISQPVYDMVREAVGDELVDEYLAAIEAAK